jgi:hypothetical protein
VRPSTLLGEFTWTMRLPHPRVLCCFALGSRV